MAEIKIFQCDWCKEETREPNPLHIGWIRGYVGLTGLELICNRCEKIRTTFLKDAKNAAMLAKKGKP